MSKSLVEAWPLLSIIYMVAPDWFLLPLGSFPPVLLPRAHAYFSLASFYPFHTLPIWCLGSPGPGSICCAPWPPCMLSCSPSTQSHLKLGHLSFLECEGSWTDIFACEFLIKSPVTCAYTHAVLPPRTCSSYVWSETNKISAWALIRASLPWGK